MISLSAITRKERISILLIGVSFLAGFLAHRYNTGLNGNIIASLFVKSTPYYLFGLCVWTLAFHQEKTRNWWIACALIVLGSYLIEVIGVETGFPFGGYEYGAMLGLKIFGVPLVIGFNWLLLTYAGLCLGRLLFKNQFLQCLAGAAFIVLLDLHIEGVAPKLDYWEFHNTFVPIENYLSWFVLCFLFQYLLLKSSPVFKNRVAPFTFVFMFLYFMSFYVF